MEQIDTIIQETIVHYQKEIHRHYPIVDMNRLKSIWEKLNNGKYNEGEKKRKTAYQNYFVVTRKVITDKNPNLKFGEISKIISSQWKTLTAEEKKKYENNTVFSPFEKQSETLELGLQKNDSYLHLFEQTMDDIDDSNRIDYEHDENQEDLDEIDDDDDENIEDEIDFDDIQD
jgi:hypothetical protein